MIYVLKMHEVSDLEVTVSSFDMVANLLSHGSYRDRTIAALCTSCTQLIRSKHILVPKLISLKVTVTGPVDLTSIRSSSRVSHRDQITY